MAQGTAVIYHVSATNDYAYEWRTDANAQGEVSTVVTGKTKAAAYSEVGTLLVALPGTLTKVTISGTSV